MVHVGGGLATDVVIFGNANLIRSAGYWYNQFRKVKVFSAEELECYLAIVNHMRSAYDLMIGEQSAEMVKMTIGSAFPMKKEMNMEVRGLDANKGLPRKVVVTSEEIREAIGGPVKGIIKAVREWNRLGRVKIHTIGLRGHNAYFMSTLAEENAGTYVVY